MATFNIKWDEAGLSGGLAFGYLQIRLDNGEDGIEYKDYVFEYPLPLTYSYLPLDKRPTLKSFSMSQKQGEPLQFSCEFDYHYD